MIALVQLSSEDWRSLGVVAVVLLILFGLWVAQVLLRPTSANEEASRTKGGER